MQDPACPALFPFDIVCDVTGNRLALEPVMSALTLAAGKADPAWLLDADRSVIDRASNDVMAVEQRPPWVGADDLEVSVSQKRN